jgi:hypothetical protein
MGQFKTQGGQKWPVGPASATPGLEYLFSKQKSSFEKALFD